MKKVLVLAVMIVMLIVAQSAFASEKADDFKKIKIFDRIMVFVDADDMIEVDAVKASAATAFEKYMRGMKINDNAYVDNYPAEGYELENVGYILMKIMSIRTEGGLNVYHIDFEFAIPPRQVYWDTAVMGVAPTTFDFKKELLEDVDEAMQEFAKVFYETRGE